MTLKELKTLQEHRAEGETLSKAKERLEKESKEATMPSTEEQLPAPLSDEDGFTQEDLVIPRIKIVQPTARIEGATEGRFRNMLTGEEKEVLEKIIVLRRENGRTLFSEGDFSGERVCWSLDGLVPAKEAILKFTGEEPQNSICVSQNGHGKIAHCPLAQWHDDKAPACRETISFLAVDQTMMPFFVIFHGTAIPSVKNFLSSVYLKIKQATLQGRELHLRHFQSTITLQRKVNEKGKFYLPVFQNITEIAMEQQPTMNQCFATLQKKLLPTKDTK